MFLKLGVNDVNFISQVVTASLLRLCQQSAPDFNVLTLRDFSVVYRFFLCTCFIYICFTLQRILCLFLMLTFILPTQVSLSMQTPCFLKTLAILVTLLFVGRHFPGQAHLEVIVHLFLGDYQLPEELVVEFFVFELLMWYVFNNRY